MAQTRRTSQNRFPSGSEDSPSIPRLHKMKLLASPESPRSAQGRPRDAPRGTQGRPRSPQRSPRDGPRHPRGTKIIQNHEELHQNRANTMLCWNSRLALVSQAFCVCVFMNFCFAQQSEQSSGHRSHTGFSQSKRVSAHWTNRSLRTTAARNL